MKSRKAQRKSTKNFLFCLIGELSRSGAWIKGSSWSKHECKCVHGWMMWMCASRHQLKQRGRSMCAWVDDVSVCIKALVEAKREANGCMDEWFECVYQGTSCNKHESKCVHWVNDVNVCTKAPVEANNEVNVLWVDGVNVCMGAWMGWGGWMGRWASGRTGGRSKMSKRVRKIIE